MWWGRQREIIHQFLHLIYINLKSKPPDEKKNNLGLFIAGVSSCCTTALHTQFCKKKNQFAPFRINCVQFLRICLFHSFQMRLWTSRVTLKISVANPFLDAWQRVYCSYGGEIEVVSALFFTLWVSLKMTEDTLKITCSEMKKKKTQLSCFLFLLIMLLLASSSTPLSDVTVERVQSELKVKGSFWYHSLLKHS